MRAIMCRIWREPGLITRLTLGCTLCPLSIAATVIKSLYEELVQLPMAT